MRGKTVCAGILIGLLLWAVGLPKIEAQQVQNASLEERIQFLEQAVLELQTSLERLESKKEDVLTKDAILRWAAEQGHVEILQALLNKGADVDASDSQGRTALMLATQRGHAIVVQVLLDNKADVNAKDQRGWTAADFAQESGYPLLLQALLNYGAQLDDAPRDQQAMPESESEAEPEAMEVEEESSSDTKESALQETSVEEDAEAEAPVKNEDDYTELMRAASEGLAEKIGELLQQGVEVNTKTSRGYTALMLAVAGNYPGIAQRLLEHGAELDAQTDKGYTALMIASAEGYTDIVRGLVERGANARLKAASGHTALGIARAQGEQEIIDVLERAELMIGPGRYQVTVDGSGFTTQLPDLTPVWRKKAEEICQGREFTVIDKKYSSPGSDTQSISGVVECQ